jgi:hypothetical protein
MLKQISVYATLLGLMTVSPLFAHESDRFHEASVAPAQFAQRIAGKGVSDTWLLKLWQVHPSGSVTRDQVNGFESRRDCNDYGSRHKAIEVRWQVEYLCEAEFQPESRGPAHAFLHEIVTWLAANFELPVTETLPKVEFASPLKLVSLRYKGKLPEGWREDRIEDPNVLAALHREVVAVYNDTTRTIYLPEGWTGATTAEQSVLVHEMVHHLQNVGAVRHECPAAREKVAYLAQSEWLKRDNLDLEKEFDVDMLTVIVNSGCMH